MLRSGRFSVPEQPDVPDYPAVLLRNPTEEELNAFGDSERLLIMAQTCIKGWVATTVLYAPRDMDEDEDENVYDALRDIARKNFNDLQLRAPRP